MVSIALIIVLIVRPEWYVINTVGILVGAGTITMLGVSFVPLIIIIFMILAAIYDAWAVYKSKHMLELADTMVGLELPVMLVAPHKGKMQPKSKMNENKNRQFQQSAQIEPIQDGGRLGETMLMGLGDVIFPGLLCISGTGDVLEPEGDVIGIGSGGNYALAAGKVLMEGDMSAEEVAKKAIKVAADICVFTNDNVKIEKIFITFLRRY